MKAGRGVADSFAAGTKFTLGALLLLVLAGPVWATPSSTCWTSISMDIQPCGVPHLGIDNYFTVDRKAPSGGQGAFPTDAGLTVGVLPGKRLQMEIGVDALNPADAPYSFNAKIGTPEGVLFTGAPAVQVGICNAGTRRGVTDQDLVYGVLGKTLPGFGRLSAGPYVGNGKVLLNARGEKENTGFMVAFDRGFAPVKDAAGSEYNTWLLAADFASGRNAIGGGGIGISRYFTRNVSLLTGPVWFKEKTLGGAWKWTTQLDINL